MCWKNKVNSLKRKIRRIGKFSVNLTVNFGGGSSRKSGNGESNDGSNGRFDGESDGGESDGGEYDSGFDNESGGGSDSGFGNVVI